MYIANMVANILPTDPHSPTQGFGVQISTFLEHGHVAYLIKGNHEMQQHGSKSFSSRPP